VGDLAAHSVRGGLATFIGQLAIFFIRLASTMVLARLLTPEDYGLVAMILAVTGFLAPFRDIGLSLATVQRREVSQAQISGLFWVNAAAGFLLAAAVAISAPLISRFYGKPVLTLMVTVFAVKYLFDGLAIQHQALLQRQMRFGVIAWIEIVANLSAFAIAVAAALSGLRQWALILQQISISGIAALGAWAACPWRPGRLARRSGIRSMVRFGGQVTATSIVGSISSQLDSLLIGRRWGADSLGLYNRAFTTMLMPINQITQPINSVALSSLCRLQPDPDRYRRYYCRLLTLLAFATTPIIALMAVMSYEIVFVLLGRQWLQASPILTALSIGLLGQPMTLTTGLVYQSLGQVNRQFRWAVLGIFVIATALFIGLRWGPLGVAVAFACVLHLWRFPSLWNAYRYSPIKIRDFLTAVWRPFAVSGIMAGSVWLAKNSLSGHGAILRLVICCLLAGIVLAGSVLLWPATRRETMGLLLLIKDLLRRPKREARSES